MAQLGEEGWELGGSSARNAGNKHKINCVFKMPVERREELREKRTAPVSSAYLSPTAAGAALRQGHLYPRTMACRIGEIVAEAPEVVDGFVQRAMVRAIDGLKLSFST